MLSSPRRQGSTPERLCLAELPPIGCAARNDLIFARARETKKDGATAGRYLSNAYFETLHPRVEAEADVPGRRRGKSPKQAERPTTKHRRHKCKDLHLPALLVEQVTGNRGSDSGRRRASCAREIMTPIVDVASSRSGNPLPPAAASTSARRGDRRRQ
jgi:hypothetical protein